MLLVGTTRNHILQGTIDLGFTTVVQGHTDEVWALSCHPQVPHFITASHDHSITLWDGLSRQPLWTKLVSEGVKCAAFLTTAADRQHQEEGTAGTVGLGIVVVGTKEGRWMVLDCESRELVCCHSDGGEAIETIQFSPDGNHLALGSHDSYVYVYSVHDSGRRFSRTGRCSGHSSTVRHVDWSQDGRYLRSASADYELLYWLPGAGCKQVATASQLRDVVWATSRCPLSFETAGVWQEGMDGTDINACARANRLSLLVTGDDWGKVSLYRFPAAHPKAARRAYSGHSCHVTNVNFLSDDSRIISTGGADAAILQWEVLPN